MNLSPTISSQHHQGPRTINVRFIFFCSGFLILIIVAVVLWLRMITSPAERTGSDFIASFSVARIAQRWGYAQVYDLDLQRSIQAEVVGFDLAPGQVLMFNHVPYLVPLLSLLVNENYVSSLIRYTLMLAVLYCLSLVAASRLFHAYGWGRADTLLALASFITFYPLIVSLINAQETAFMLFGAFLWVLGLITGKDWLAGVGLALTTVRPHVTVLLAIPVFIRRTKTLIWFLLAAGSLALISFLVLGGGAIRAFLDTLLMTSGGVWFGLHEEAMVNFVGLLWRLAPAAGGNLIHLLGWIVYGLSLASLCVLVARSRGSLEKQIGIGVTLTVFAVPHLHYHDLTLLLVPLALAMVFLVKQGFVKARHICLLPLAASLFLLFGSLVPALKYNIPFLLMAMLIIILWLPQRIFRQKTNLVEAA